jgi:hypothetical protein
VQVHLQNEEVNQAVLVLLKARNELANAIKEQVQLDAIKKSNENSRLTERSIIAGDFTENDEFGTKIIQARETIRSKMESARKFL